MFKPFKPPAIRSVTRPVPVDVDEAESPPRPTKKRRLLEHVIEDSPPKKTLFKTSGVSAPRKPLIPAKNSIESKTQVETNLNDQESYYMVLWRKFTTKKHKTWDGDGVLSVYGGYAHLQDVEGGRSIGRCPYRDPLLPGSTMSVGGRDVEVDSILSKEDFLAGKPFMYNSTQRPAGPVSSTPLPKTPIVLPKGKVPLPRRKKDEPPEMEEIPAASFYATAKTTTMKAQFRNPLLATTIMPPTDDGAPTPRHNANAPGALVMKRPTTCPKGRQIVDVVLDPFLGRHLRQHQREGIQFLYQCVMGMRDYDGRGALLADEMGLGKTLQTICLLWTLLKQNPIHGADPVIKKALIVCPVTLIDNWKKEFNKWLGNERIGVFVEDGQNKKRKITDFTHGKSYSVMIIGYERLRSLHDDLKKGAGIDIVIADEGHRLKTAQNKSAQAIRNLDTDRRVILSGTPMQNDLSEFYTMVDFINPGLLGKYNTFKKEFEGPILKSRQPHASERDIEKGAARGEELSTVTKPFILRRTADLLSMYLKSKTEYVVFCKPTRAQAEIYQHIISSPFFGKAIGASEASLQLITILKKVCNAPSLLMEKGDTPANPLVAALLDVIPQSLMHMSNVNASSKFRVLDQLLKRISSTTPEKVVIVSNYTSTLDLIGQHLTSMSLPFLRLDGKTAQKSRQGLVDDFNRTDASRSFAFLLSAKSGGSGLNLIGASRLILFDVDWNPATDQQAMARIHRDGQKRPVKIYRFVLAGGMDEKIYQRQVTKIGLADSVVDGKKSEGSFTAEELRDLFRLDLNAGCQTHELLGCDCKGVGADLSPTESVPETGSLGMSVDENLDDDDDDTLFPPAHAIVAATKTNVAAVEKQIADEAKRRKAKNSEGKMKALMMYKHIDTSIFRGPTEDVFGYEYQGFTEVKAALDDEVLVGVLKAANCKICYLFAKRDGAQEILSHEAESPQTSESIWLQTFHAFWLGWRAVIGARRGHCRHQEIGTDHPDLERTVHYTSLRGNISHPVTLFLPWKLLDAPLSDSSHQSLVTVEKTLPPADLPQVEKSSATTPVALVSETEEGNKMSGTDYSYDEQGQFFPYFVFTVVGIITVPLTYSVLKPSSDPGATAPRIKSDFRPEHADLVDSQRKAQRRKERKIKRGIAVVAGWVIMAFMAYLIVSTARTVPKIWNPYDILGIKDSATEKEIKSHYKRMSLKFHPDKIRPDPAKNITVESLNDRFVEITKAYKALTDEDIRRNYQEFGHPDGKQSYSIGIALPKFIITDGNGKYVILVYAALLGVLLPYLVGSWWYGTQRMSKEKVLIESANNLFREYEEGITEAGIIGALTTGLEFQEILKGEKAESGLSKLESRILAEGDATPFASGLTVKERTKLEDLEGGARRKALGLLWAYLGRVELDDTALNQSKVDVAPIAQALSSAFAVIALAFSTTGPIMASYFTTQHLLQAIPPGGSPLLQLPHITPAIARAIEGDAKTHLTLQQYMNLPEAYRKRLSVGNGLLTDSEYKAAISVARQLPRLQVEKVFFKVVGEKFITPGSLVSFVVKGRFIPPGSENVPEVNELDLEDVDPDEDDVNAINGRQSVGKDGKKAKQEKPVQPPLAFAPYFAREYSPRWHVFLTDSKQGKIAVPPFTFTTFDKPIYDESGKPTYNMQTLKAQFQAPTSAGNYTFVFNLVCDSYLGFDTKMEVTLVVADASEAAEIAEEDEISEPDEDSIAGQMQALKTGGISGAAPAPKKKKKPVEESSDEESDTDGEEAADTSETDTDTDDE